MIVVGSMNMDVIIHMSHLPAPGESLLARRIIHLPGGKGANQAVGAAKLGGNVYAIGCLGEDQEGRLLYNSLAENGVNTTGVRIIRNEPTGKAYILVAEQGESTFVLSHGANGALQPGMVQEHGEHFAHAAFCLLSTEIPWETVLATLDLCTRHHVKVIVKPTTETPIPDGVLEHITFLIPNEQELDVLVPGAMPVAEKAAHLFACGVENVIVTLGDQGCYLHNREMKRAFPAANFTAVDTTGAGDAFISAFAVALSEGNSIPAAIQFATYAAGISVTRDGVQPALAGRMALEMYADQYSAPWPERV
jgi:ribokinase